MGESGGDDDDGSVILLINDFNFDFLTKCRNEGWEKGRCLRRRNEKKEERRERGRVRGREGRESKGERRTQMCKGVKEG